MEARFPIAYMLFFPTYPYRGIEYHTKILTLSKYNIIPHMILDLILDLTFDLIFSTASQI